MALTHEGAEVWKADLGPVKGGHGFGASPMVYGDLVVINNDQDGESSLIAVNKFNGDKVWEIPRKSKRLSYSIPVVLPTDNGDVLVFTNWQHGFTVVDPNTGDVLAELSTFNTEVNERAISSPVLAGDLVIGACGFTAEPKHCVAVKFDGKELKEVWRVERSVPHIPSPIVVGDYVYLWEDKGIGTCLNHQTGEEIWRKRIGGNFFGSPVSDGEKLFAVDDAGVVVAIAASPEFQELGRNPLGPDVLCRSTPAIANGNLYVRTFDELLAVKGR